MIMVLQNPSIASPPAIDYESIIRNESIIPYFQPIVSIKQRRIVGFEALLRGIDPQTSAIVPPYPILKYARDHSLSCDLQRSMCKKAVATFSQFCLQVPGGEEFFLTLNTDPFLVQERFCSLRCMLKVLRQEKVPFRNIVFEIVESGVTNLKDLEVFCNLIRENDFLIALDDVGKGHSNLNRVVAIRPDIIKLDKFLVKNIHNEYHKQEVVKSLINLSHKTGALVIAEGIETEEEAIPNLSSNADMLQGYFFSMPGTFSEISIEMINKQLKYLEWLFSRAVHNRVDHKRDILRSYDTIITHMVNDFSTCSLADFEKIARERIGRHKNFECLYLLDENGIQVTDTISSEIQPLKPKSILFHPANRGTDQFSKEYFQYMDMGLKKYITDPYISMASGNLCITISVAFTNSDKKYVLCIDAIPDFLYS